MASGAAAGAPATDLDGVGAWRVEGAVSSSQRTKYDFLQWAYAQMAGGVPRQVICDELLFGKVDSPLDRAPRSEAEQDLSAVMVDRNLLGRAMEKAGRVDDAIALYEANVADQFGGSHPYDRLERLYRKRGDSTNVLRVKQIRKTLTSS